jgi:transmembrane sensor
MINEELTLLATKVSEGKATIAELALYNAACEAFQKEEIDWPDMETDLVEMEKASLKRLWAEQPDKVAGTVKLWPRITAAAAAVAAIVFGIWFFNSDTGILKQVEMNSAQAVNDIAPGRNMATITLANGKIINLNNAKTGLVIDGSSLKYNDGSLVQNGAPSPGAKEMVTASTPRGGTYQITLPDGTHVWLNADSKISFPSQFFGGVRKIMLTGEAYFEVAKDKIHPFVVESRGQSVEVLGTHFNINSYPDESQVQTTLLEGKVKVTGMQGHKLLRPGEQSVLTGTGLFVRKANEEEALAWKNGLFVFNNEPLESIMRKLARWYDIDVVYLDIDKSQVFAGGISKYGSISRILAKMEKTGGIHFKIEGRRVIVTK